MATMILFPVLLLLCYEPLLAEVSITNESLLQRLEHLENKVSGLETVNADLRETNRALLSTLREENAQRSDGERSRRFVLADTDTVAFTAAVAPQMVANMKSMDIIKFETVITDIGSGYNNQTGVFVAPISGVYMFSCSLLDDESHTTVHAEIVHNQRILARVFAHAEPGSYRDQGANTVFAQVNQGEQVWVRVIENSQLTLGGQLYSTFSGYLMSALQ